MVNRMRATRAHRDNRRSHHALEGMRLSTCPVCNSAHIRHVACENCGKYRGKMVLDVQAQIAKREKKMKAREATAVK
jgi:large subunit ribosomal protein L32